MLLCPLEFCGADGHGRDSSARHYGMFRTSLVDKRTFAASFFASRGSGGTRHFDSSRGRFLITEGWFGLTGDGLGPTGEGMPCGCFADGYSYLLDEDEERSCPERGAINFASGPQVVGHQDN